MKSTGAQTLGDVVRQLREEKGMSQQELGERAGYETGAGISILRIERQGVVPRPKRMNALADALGVDPEVLINARGEKPKPADVVSDSVAARIERLKAEGGRRTQLESDLRRLEDARERANTRFLLRLPPIADRIQGVDQSELASSKAEADASEAAEANYSLSFARLGLAHALVEAAVDTRSYAGLVSGVAASVASAAIPSVAVSSAALSSLGSMLRIAQPRAHLIAGVGGLVAMAAALATTVLAESMAARTQRQREQLIANLEAAEAEMTDSAASLEALESIVSRATGLFDDIATHAGRALDRWERRVGAVTEWFDVAERDREAYRGFIDVAAAQLTVATINLQDLLVLRGHDLDEARRIADDILTQAQDVIDAHV